MLWGSKTAFPSVQEEANFSICFPYFENIFPNFQSNAGGFEKFQYTEECEEQRESLL